MGINENIPADMILIIYAVYDIQIKYCIITNKTTILMEINKLS